MGEQERRNVAFERVVSILESFKADELFQMDLKDEQCLTAIRHWTQEKRADPSMVERQFNENYRIQNVYNRLKVIQAACREVPMGVPMNAILAGSTNPYYGISSPKPIPKPIPSLKQEESRKKEAEREREKSIGAVADRENNVVGKEDKVVEVENAPVKEAAFPSWFNLNLTWQNILAWWSVQVVFVALFIQYIR